MCCTEKSASADDVTDGFVVVEKSDIPAHDSEQVQQSMPAAKQEAELTSAAKPEAKPAAVEVKDDANKEVDASQDKPLNDDVATASNESGKDTVPIDDKPEAEDGSLTSKAIAPELTTTDADGGKSAAVAGVTEAGDSTLSSDVTSDDALAAKQSSPLKAAVKAPTNGDVAAADVPNDAACVNGSVNGTSS